MVEKIRNFCIIAHIDHGKSTLADRLLEITGTVSKREMKEQLLDGMDLEREKGITIKLQPVRMQWQGMELNLIDTPGHADFGYEVSRSLYAVEGALLVVDATQGIQAQTLANVYLALEADLEIIPVINKVDLPAADVSKVEAEIIALLGCKPEDIVRISAKTGMGVEGLLDQIITRVPAPILSEDSRLKALIFDSFYDEYRGVILYVRVFSGELKAQDKLRLIQNQADCLATEVGHFAPKYQKDRLLGQGQIGYIVTNLKDLEKARVGDTISLQADPVEQPLPGYKEVRPFVYAGIFPSSNQDYPQLRDAMVKLSLNDSALVYQPESAEVLGFGFRIGCLGLLHLEIVKERLSREYDLDVIITNPTVEYQYLGVDNQVYSLHSAGDLPDPTRIAEIREPWVAGEIVVPNKYLGSVIELVHSIRGRQKELSYLDQEMVVMGFEAPMANLLTDFYDRVKSLTAGYGSYNYQFDQFIADDLVKLDILVAGDKVDALSMIVHRKEAVSVGREVLDKLLKILPRQQFQISLQAAIGGKIIAREDIRSMGKNVTAKLYGGDVTRKNKLRDKQKAGKKRMKQLGKVEIPHEAFMVLMKRDD
ncbi:translation elongation factor 4 [Candidatus Saccharibacteria bacterium]|nr:translation elongation factor 4 [Candidatus Saccharibacteria bacterium]